MPDLNDLPADILRLILSKLSCRSMLVAACTCRSMRKLVDSMPLRPVMTSQTVGMFGWMRRPDVAVRIDSFIARNCLRGKCQFLELLTNVQKLIVAYGRVTACTMAWLPSSLTYLDIHRVRCSPDDVFSLSRVSHLVNLHTLKLTFASLWDMIVVEDLAPNLRRLSIRCAPIVVVREPLVLDSIHVHAVSRLICACPMTARHVHVECDESELPLGDMLTPHGVARIETLMVAGPHMVTLPHLDSMRSLRSLDVHFDSFVVNTRHLSGTLRRLLVDVQFGVATTGHGGMSEDVDIDIHIGGVPVNKSEVRSMFFCK